MRVLRTTLFFLLMAPLSSFAQEVPLGEAWGALSEGERPRVEQILRDTKLVPLGAELTSEIPPGPASGDTFIPASNAGQAACYAAYAVAIAACGDDSQCREVTDAALRICLVAAG